jgi:hypothetical protein
MSRDHHTPLRDVTADTEKTAYSTVACWTVFTELLPGNALIKSVTIYFYSYVWRYENIKIWCNLNTAIVN